MHEVIQLTDCPEILQAEVNDYVSRHNGIEILEVQKFIHTHYKDKTIYDTTYKVITIYGNLFCVFKTAICSNPEMTISKVYKNCMIAGEIADIIRLSPEWFHNSK